jgi:DNA invertase Pin-like site-specific DNA recombinase
MLFAHPQSFILGTINMASFRAYCRVSPPQDVDSGSLDNQTARIEAFCRDNDGELLKVYQDVASGATLDRAQLQALLADVCAGETIVVVDFSRLSRTTLDGILLLRRLKAINVNVVSLTQPCDIYAPEGEARATMHFCLAQLERETTALKVSGAMQTLSAQGKLRGRPPFGWRFNGKENDFAPVPEQQRVLEKIKALYAQGATTNAIAKRLNLDGDNTCIAANKRHPEKYARSRFGHSAVAIILRDAGLLARSDAAKQKPLAERIVSHRK